VVFGGINYTITGIIGIVIAFRTVSETTQFTHFTVAHAHQGLYAFFTMTMFGAIYYIMPRLLQREWPSSTLIGAHFWSTALGCIVYFLALSIGGVIQGVEMNSPAIPFLDVVKHSVPWLFSRSVAGVLMTIGHSALLVNLGWMLCTKRVEGYSSPTLFPAGKEGSR
jgi:cytochrome c oxidase cbb3-type subunit 1